ncbi:uncharacterized protein NMK_1812 [Novimethylophilus kurashikiensis]|uniref:Lipoprotein n=1 Tax=Novimethylophilus kurashikiensis TaxID=1825523 RepID=A0A2R5F7S7_9PROT|nr:hypothetical protein [Novimethylophilus kurashikiensis]GBG14247.1 uncharacterized protein NMK_1812 [Novimethylophilus kurashikiensis]
MRLILIALAAAFVSGCSQLPAIFHKPSSAPAPKAAEVKPVSAPMVVLSAGQTVSLGVETLAIWGEDPCQPGYSGHDKLECIVITGKSKVRVHFIRNGMLTVEDWSVIQVGSKYKLVTGDGIAAREVFE